MTQESNKNNELRTKPSTDVHIRSYFNGCISQELQATYMHQVSKYPILTQEEEVKWTKQHFESKKQLHDILEKFPSLLMSVINSLAIAQNHIKVERFFFSGTQSDEGGDQKLKELFNDVVSSLSEIGIDEAVADSKNIQKKYSAFYKTFHQLAPRDSFYQICLEKLTDESINAFFIPKDKWELLKPELARLQQLMKQASDALIEHNLRLVISIAGHYMGTSIPLADLVQEGNIGLMRAVDKFDYRLGHRFTTYASYWIRQAITKYITNHSRIIRMPANTVAQISTIRQAEQRYLTETGRIPTPDELSTLVGISATKIVALQKMIQQPLSLHAMIDEDNTLEDNIPDPNTRTQNNGTDIQNLRDSLSQVLSTLDERERTVIELNFGLNDGKCFTLAEISKLLGVSSERVRQIKTMAIQKMRVPSLRTQLDVF